MSMELRIYGRKQGGNLIGFFDRLKLGDPPKARTEEEARGGQTDKGERGGEVTQL